MTQKIKPINKIELTNRDNHTNLINNTIKCAVSDNCSSVVKNTHYLYAHINIGSKSPQ